MSEIVRSLFAKGALAVERFLDPLGRFMEEPANSAGLRLVLLGLAKPGRGKAPKLTDLEDMWRRLAGTPLLDKQLGSVATSLHLEYQQIRRFIYFQHAQNGRDAALLALTGTHELEQRGWLSNAHDSLVDIGLATAPFPSAILNAIEADNPAALLSGVADAKNADPDPPAAAAAISALLVRGDLGAAALKSLRTVAGVDREDIQLLARALFYKLQTDDSSTLADRSYYVAYRYSTQIFEIVKTFLVINGPHHSSTGGFTFSHHYYSPLTGIRRVSTGGILGFDRTLYFSGLSSPDLGESLAASLPDLPRGLKIIAADVEKVRQQYRLIPAVFLSTALEWQPIVGRLAMVHIGFESRIGRISRADVVPGVLKSRADLRADLERVCDRTGGTYEAANYTDLTERVLAAMNNMPLRDREYKKDTVGVIRALTPEDETEPRR